jgi:hypothetical protein
MSGSELLTRGTIWLALGCYALGALLLLAPQPRLKALATARWVWTVGCGAFLLHVICAFNYYHAWSHAAAYQDTARQVGETVGWAWGGGIFFSYAFTLFWLLDVGWWWLKGKESYARRPRLLILIWHGFFFFMVFNSTVVFETGPARWFGLLICSGLTFGLVTSRRRGAECDLIE